MSHPLLEEVIFGSGRGEDVRRRSLTIGDFRTKTSVFGNRWDSLGRFIGCAEPSRKLSNGKKS